MHCVTKELFYRELNNLKQKQKRSESLITLFIEDQFYDEAKEVLKVQAEGRKDSQSKEANQGKLQATATTLKRKKWHYNEDKILTHDNKIVVPKTQLFEVLSLAHKRTNHRGRQITSKWINESYSEVNVRVLNLFVGLCRIHEEQKTITSHVKVVQYCPRERVHAGPRVCGHGTTGPRARDRGIAGAGLRRHSFLNNNSNHRNIIGFTEIFY